MELRQLVPYLTAHKHAFVKSGLGHTSKLGGCWFDGSRGEHMTNQQSKEQMLERMHVCMNGCMNE